jgi:hypothetical protein
LVSFIVSFLTLETASACRDPLSAAPANYLNSIDTRMQASPHGCTTASLLLIVIFRKLSFPPFPFVLQDQKVRLFTRLCIKNVYKIRALCKMQFKSGCYIYKIKG